MGRPAQEGFALNVRLTLLLVALAPAAAVARDLAPGTWQLSGASTVGLSRQTSSTPMYDVTDSSLQASGEVLYHVARNLGVGLGTSFRFSDTDVELKDAGPLMTAGGGSSTSWAVGPYAAWRAPLGARVSFVAHAGVMYARAHYSGPAPLSPSTTDGLSATGGAGLSWFVVDRVSLDGQLAYHWTRYGTSDARTTTSDLSALLGVSVYLGGS